MVIFSWIRNDLAGFPNPEELLQRFQERARSERVNDACASGYAMAYGALQVHFSSAVRHLTTVLNELDKVELRCKALSLAIEYQVDDEVRTMLFEASDVHENRLKAGLPNITRVLDEDELARGNLTQTGCVDGDEVVPVEPVEF